MKFPRRDFLHLAAGAAALPAASQLAWAQAYPAHPITIIVPYAAGGPADALARVLSERMRAALGQPIIIENVVGASGTIGVTRAVRAAPNGYTLSLGHVGSPVVNGALFALPFDLLKDLEPVALLPSNSLFIVARKNFPAGDLKDLIAWLKANPARRRPEPRAPVAGRMSMASISRMPRAPISSSCRTAAPDRP